MVLSNKNTKIIFPTSITLLNWLAGVSSIILSASGLFIEATLLILIAGFLDFFDGLVARTVDAVSDFGKELDSFSDSVSFGLAPSFLMYFYFQQFGVFDSILVFSAFIPASGVILRLARFNSSQSDSSDFYGLASPGSALLIIGWFFAFLFKEGSWLNTLSESPAFWIGLILVTTVLMLSNVKMFSLKIKNFNWRGNEIFWIFIILSVIIIVVFQIIALFLILCLYIIMSFIYHFVNKKNNQI